MDPFTQVKLAKHMIWLNLKEKPSQIGVHFPISIKKGVVREIEAAGICFVIECGRRKSQQIPRVRLRAQIKLVYTV